MSVTKGSGVLVRNLAKKKGRVTAASRKKHARALSMAARFAKEGGVSRSTALRKAWKSVNKGAGRRRSNILNRKKDKA